MTCRSLAVFAAFCLTAATPAAARSELWREMQSPDGASLKNDVVMYGELSAVTSDAFDAKLAKGGSSSGLIFNDTTTMVHPMLEVLGQYAASGYKANAAVSFAGYELLTGSDPMLYATFSNGTEFFHQTWIGFVAYNKATEDLVVAMRGTKTNEELKVDLKSCKEKTTLRCKEPPGLYIDTLRMENLPISQDAMTRIQQLKESATGNATVIHQGFFDYYSTACKKADPQDPLYNCYNPLSLREQISTAITAAGSTFHIKTLTFTGHSLGAALAAIAALDANTLAWDVAVGATVGAPAEIRTFTYAQPRIGGSVESFHIQSEELAKKNSLEALKFVYGLSGSSKALLHRIANTNDAVTTKVFPKLTSGLKPVHVTNFITHYPLDPGAYTYNTTALRNSGVLLKRFKPLNKEGEEHSTDQYLYSINSDVDEVGTKGAWWLDASFMQKNGDLTPAGTFLVQNMTNEPELLYPFNTSDPDWYVGVLASIIGGDEGPRSCVA